MCVAVLLQRLLNEEVLKQKIKEAEVLIREAIVQVLFFFFYVANSDCPEFTILEI